MKLGTQNKAVMVLCVGPILFAMTVSAHRNNDYRYPTPAPASSADSSDSSDSSAATAPEAYTEYSYESPTEIYPGTPTPTTGDSPGPYTDATPGPVYDATPALTDDDVENTEEGAMPVIPSSTAGNGEEEENVAAPMNNAVDGASCSTYDEDVDVASFLPETCEWNTYMCCWTGHDGQETMYGNTDICRVLDYPEEGDVLEMPRDDEGPVYCHGFAWEDAADMDTHVLPLYHYVKNINRTDDGGYYGNVEGSPECGCIETMPVVSESACSKFGREGIKPCWDNSLRSQYKYKLDEPNGEMEFNLVRECDNEDVPDFDFLSCDHNTYMCCWTENDGQGMADNTDVCRVGQMEYPGASEGEVHCHGFVWPEDATEKYIHLLAQFVQHFDHRDRRGYYGNLPDAPMCSCIENMPEVSEADCTTYDDEVGREGKFKACTNNDLRTRYQEVYPTGELANLVEQCDNEVSS
ncbi:unnamed protein product [Pylaiella littoralis]